MSIEKTETVKAQISNLGGITSGTSGQTVFLNNGIISTSPAQVTSPNSIGVPNANNTVVSPTPVIPDTTNAPRYTGPNVTPTDSAPIVGNNITTYTTLSPLPCISSPTVTCSGGNGSLMNEVDINGYVQKMFNLFIALAGVAAVFMLVLGGFEYMTTDAFQGKENARARLSNAVKGLLLVLCSFLILRTINPKLVDIPNGLVAPLGIKENDATQNALGGINLLQSQIDQNNATAVAQLAQAQQAASQAAAAYTQQAALCDQLAQSIGAPTGQDAEGCAAMAQNASALGGPAAVAIANQMTIAQDQETTQLTTASVATAQSLMSSENSTFDSSIKGNTDLTSINNRINTELKKIDYIAATQQPPESLSGTLTIPAGNTNSTQVGITQQAALSKANIELDGVQQMLSANSSWSNPSWTSLTQDNTILGVIQNGRADTYTTVKDYITAAQANLDSVKNNGQITQDQIDQMQTKINAVKSIVNKQVGPNSQL